MSNRGRWFVLAVVILCSGVLQYETLTKGHDWGDDFASYIMQARSIAEGSLRSFIEENKFTVEQSTRMVGPVAAPWGTPLMLAPLYRLFGPNMLALKGLNVACYILFLASLAFFLRDRHPFPLLVLLVSFFAFNPMLLSLLNEILSDFPFLLLSTVCVFLIGRVAVEDRPLFGRVVDRCLLGALFAAALFTRTNGLLLVVTLVGVHLVRIGRAAAAAPAAAGGAVGWGRAARESAVRFGTRRMLLDGIPYAVCVLLVLAWNGVFAHGGGSNAHYFGAVSWKTFLRNVFFYVEIPSDFYFGIPVHHAWYVVSLPFLFAGMWKSARRDVHMILYMVMTVGLFLLWPYTQGIRYILPVMPFYVHFVFIGARWTYEAAAGTRRAVARVLVPGLLILAAVLFAQSSVSRALDNMRAHRPPPPGPSTDASREMFDFIRNDTGKDAVIIFFKPRLMRMLTERPSIVVDNPSALERGDYLCFHVMKRPYYQLSLKDVVRLVNEGRLFQVFENPDFRVYRIVHSVGRA
jgi:hypothetical protein